MRGYLFFVVINFYFIITLSLFLTSTRSSSFERKKPETSTVPAVADVDDQFNVTRCNSTLEKLCKGARKGFTKCWYGTTEKNTYCCNETVIKNNKPGENDLFAPSICCTANGGKCFSGTLCCGNGCSKQGIPIPSALGVCSKGAPNDHTQISFRKCARIVSGSNSPTDAAVCKVNTIKKDHDTCFEGVSPPSPGGPELIATTCCNPQELKGKVPDKDEFLQPRSCCLPLGGLCLFSDTCCSGFCGGLENSNNSGFCGYKNGSSFTPTGISNMTTPGLDLLAQFDLTVN